MSSLLKRIGYAVVFTMFGVYVFLEMTGPRGLGELRQKREEIQALQEGNEEVRRRNEMRKERIRRLEDSREEQELEIRRRFRLRKKGTVDFFLPPGEAASEDPPSEPSVTP